MDRDAPAAWQPIPAARDHIKRYASVWVPPMFRGESWTDMTLAEFQQRLESFKKHEVNQFGHKLQVMDHAAKTSWMLTSWSSDSTRLCQRENRTHIIEFMRQQQSSTLTSFVAELTEFRDAVASEQAKMCVVPLDSRFKFFVNHCHFHRLLDHIPAVTLGMLEYCQEPRTGALADAVVQNVELGTLPMPDTQEMLEECATWGESQVHPSLAKAELVLDGAATQPSCEKQGARSSSSKLEKQSDSQSSLVATLRSPPVKRELSQSPTAMASNPGAKKSATAAKSGKI